MHTGRAIILCSVLLSSPLSAQAPVRLPLREAIALALRNYPAAVVSSLSVDAARGRRWAGVSPPPPEISVEYEYIPAGRPLSEFGERSLEISQSIDFPIATVFRTRAASWDVGAAEAGHRAVELAVVAGARIAYASVLVAIEKLRLAEEDLAICRDIEAQATLRFDLGEATNMERVSAAVQLTQARSALDRAGNELIAARAGLSHRLGDPPGDALRQYELTDSLGVDPFPLSIEQSMERALLYNPLLSAARSRRASANAGRTAAWWGMLPGFNASYRWQSAGGRSDLHGLRLGMSVPLWFALDNRGRIMEADAAAAVAEALVCEMQNDIALELRREYLNVRNDEAAISMHRRELLPQAEEVFRAARVGYDSGETGWLELLAARQILVGARKSFIDELGQYHASRARLEQALGGIDDFIDTGTGE